MYIWTMCQNRSGISETNCTEREETARIDTPNKLKNNKSVNHHSFECTLKGYNRISDLSLEKYYVIISFKYSDGIHFLY